MKRKKKKLDAQNGKWLTNKNGKNRKNLEKIWNSKKALIGTPEISDPKYSI